MNSKSAPDRLPPFSFRWLVHKTAPAAILALDIFWLLSLFAAAPQPQGAPPTTTRQAGNLELHHPVERDGGAAFSACKRVVDHGGRRRQQQPSFAALESLVARLG